MRRVDFIPSIAVTEHQKTTNALTEELQEREVNPSNRQHSGHRRAVVSEETSQREEGDRLCGRGLSVGHVERTCV